MSLPNNNYAEVMAIAFEDELRKIAEAKIAAGNFVNAKNVGLVGAGALGYEALRRAERDRRMGRAVRLQQNY